MSLARYEWNFQIYAWYHYGNYTDAKTDKRYHSLVFIMCISNRSYPTRYVKPPHSI